ncbi:flotillin family protein [Agrobacterium rubi]|nr:flotillin family protein [Agrobacterium rubi]NTF24120.1 flotillin family protein [Agrobacterium rubi]
MDFLPDSFSTILIAAVIVLLIVGFGIMFSRLYTRATKETAFVRTGLGGEKVVLDGGALVFPVLHEVIKVNMNTLRLDVRRQAQNSLITKDKLRVDVQAEFYVRVGKSEESIGNAATTLGSKTTRPAELASLIEGKFVDALRSVAASMAMGELHEQRKQFVAAVQDAVQVDLKKNGLELESVSLTGLDQTAREYFNENNAFDAEGLTKLTQEIESRRKQRNEIEQNTRVDIERKRTEADKSAYTISQENELAKIAQQKALDENRAQTEAEVAKTVAEQKRIAEEADIARARAVEVASIEKARDLALSEQDKKIKLAQKTEEEAAATAKANLAKAAAVKAEEQVETARKTEVANRDKAIAVIKAEQEAEQEAVGVRVTAQAEKQAAVDRAEAVVRQATAEKDRDTLRAEGIKAVGAAEAEALERRNTAENNLSEGSANLRLRLALTKELSSIISASVKPLEKINSIRIVDLDGFAPGGNGQGGSEGGAETADRVVNAALRHRAVAPLVDNIMNEVGLLGGLGALATGKSELFSELTPSAKTTEIVSSETPTVQ